MCPCQRPADGGGQFLCGAGPMRGCQQWAYNSGNASASKNTIILCTIEMKMCVVNFADCCCVRWTKRCCKDQQDTARSPTHFAPIWMVYTNWQVQRCSTVCCRVDLACQFFHSLVFQLLTMRLPTTVRIADIEAVGDTEAREHIRQVCEFVTSYLNCIVIQKQSC